MNYLIYILAFLLFSCKGRIDINNIEVREHGLNYIKGTNKLVTGEVVRKFESGKIAELQNFNNGKAIGEWYAYGYQGEIISHGFGVDAKKYEKGLNVDLTYSFLSINIEGSFAFATLYLDNNKLFNQQKLLIDISKEIFEDYSDKYKIDDILIYDKEHEYTISKAATTSNTFKADTVLDKSKKTIFIK